MQRVWCSLGSCAPRHMKLTVWHIFQIQPRTQPSLQLTEQSWAAPPEYRMKNTAFASIYALEMCTNQNIIMVAVAIDFFPSRHRKVGWHAETTVRDGGALSVHTRLLSKCLHLEMRHCVALYAVSHYVRALLQRRYHKLPDYDYTSYYDCRSSLAIVMVFMPKQ